MHAHCPQHATVQEGADILVHRRQGNRRYLFPGSLVDGFRAGMSVQGHHRLIDHLPLVGGRQAMPMAESAEFSWSEYLLDDNSYYLT